MSEINNAQTILDGIDRIREIDPTTACSEITKLIEIAKNSKDMIPTRRDEINLRINEVLTDSDLDYDLVSSLKDLNLTLNPSPGFEKSGYSYKRILNAWPKNVDDIDALVDWYSNELDEFSNNNSSFCPLHYLEDFFDSLIFAIAEVKGISAEKVNKFVLKQEPAICEDNSNYPFSSDELNITHTLSVDFMGTHVLSVRVDNDFHGLHIEYENKSTMKELFGKLLKELERLN